MARREISVHVRMPDRQARNFDFKFCIEGNTCSYHYQMRKMLLLIIYVFVHGNTLHLYDRERSLCFFFINLSIL